MLNNFNESLERFWPCPLSEYLGYVCCPITCGMSLFLPRICIKDAEKCLKTNMEYYNKYRLKHSGIQIKLVKKCSTSWLEISLLPLDPDGESENIELMPHQKTQANIIVSDVQSQN
jgi:hypothetical protein